MELSVITFVSPNTEGVQKLQQFFFDEVAKQTNGSVTFKIRGGPEVIDPNNLGKAVATDAVDIGFIYYGAYEPLVPGISALTYSQLTPEEERNPAVWNVLQQMHAKSGIYYLQRGGGTSSNYYFYTWTNFPVKTLADLKGHLIGSATAGQAAVQAWGAKWVNVAVADNYPAMQHGEVEGIAGQPCDNLVTQKWYEVTKYAIDHPYYRPTMSTIMNLNKLNSLSPNLQKIVKDVAATSENQKQLWMDQKEAEDKVFLQQKGITFIAFSEEDARSYVQSAYDQAWALLQQKFPDITSQLKKLLTKQ